MNYHQTDENGFYIGTFAAEVSPLEPDIFDENGDLISPAVFLIPRGGVVASAPVLAAGECAKWNGAGWDVLPDLRGQVYWMSDHTRHEITARGVALPPGALPSDPPKSQAEIDAEGSAKAKAELIALDMASIRDIRAYIAAKADAPQTLKDREALAVLTRARVKP